MVGRDVFATVCRVHAAKTARLDSIFGRVKNGICSLSSSRDIMAGCKENAPARCCLWLSAKCSIYYKSSSWTPSAVDAEVDTANHSWHF